MVGNVAINGDPRDEFLVATDLIPQEQLKHWHLALRALGQSFNTARNVVFCT